MPLTLRGERGEQARETEQFVAALRMKLRIPVEFFDERLFFAAVLDGVVVATQHARSVGNRFFVTDLRRRTIEVGRVSTLIKSRHLERTTRAR